MPSEEERYAIYPNMNLSEQDRIHDLEDRIKQLAKKA